ncbi:MAG: short-chain dehydrogenase [Melioribacteraceae bacterium]|nr:MAG: short-chain dehydrogenase [Melioribacteraceae bacterium]
MLSLKNKIVFITGASAGIGAACATEFAKVGANLILSARRKEKVDELADKLRAEYGIKTLAFKLDVKDKAEIKAVIDAIPVEWKSIDILLNNAGLGRGLNKVYEDDPENWEEMIETNVKGLLHVTRNIVPGMVLRGTGHVINLGSIAGHMAYPGGGVYCATKHAVKAISDSMRMELVDKNVRVSSVDPGMVETEFSVVRFGGDEERAKNVYKGVDPLTAEDIADAVMFVATRKPHVNINEMIIMPSVQANAFVTHRR